MSRAPRAVAGEGGQRGRASYYYKIMMLFNTKNISSPKTSPLFLCMSLPPPPLCTNSLVHVSSQIE